MDAVLEAFANKQDQQQSKAKGIKLVAQASKNGGEGDARWTDYVLDYADSRRMQPKFRRVFRLPEGAELPTTMTEEWSTGGKTFSRWYSMEYPADGPADLYALNVPKYAAVVDTRSGDELKTLLAAYSAQQKSEFDAYSATTLTTVEGYVAEEVDFEQLLKFKTERYQAEGRIVPENVDRVEWWQAEVGKLAFKQFGQSDMFSPGQTFCPDLFGYPTNVTGHCNRSVTPVCQPVSCYR